jgi:hypothetical protein
MSNLKPDGELCTSAGTGTGTGSGGALEEEVGLRPRDWSGEAHAEEGLRGPSAARRDGPAIAPGAFQPLPFARGGAACVRRAGVCGLGCPAGQALSPRPPGLGEGCALAVRPTPAARESLAPTQGPARCPPRRASPRWPGPRPGLEGAERD